MASLAATAVAAAVAAAAAVTASAVAAEVKRDGSPPRNGREPIDELGERGTHVGPSAGGQLGGKLVCLRRRNFVLNRGRRIAPAEICIQTVYSIRFWSLLRARAVSSCLATGKN